MWLRISTQHLKNAADNQHALEQRFFEYRFHPENDVMHHITEIETIANQLRDINAPVTESQIMTKIINTLPPSFRGFMSAWDSVPIPDRTINSLTSRLLKEECLMKQWNRGKMYHQDAAFFSKNFPPSRWPDSYTPCGRVRGKKGRGSWRNDHPSRRQPYRTCTYHRCGRPKHTIDVCRQRIRDEKSAKASDTKATPAVIIEKKDASVKRDDAAEDSAYMSATCFLSRHAHDWFADSGATGHMTNQRSFFSSFTPVLHDTWTVKGIGISSICTRPRNN
ncbi:uncharacterized protein LOC116930531 [Daphnia magna]|uniref:uncharacterized protein LOC116930531 n=1 Tax=Daphnia magna TaxID=35525 RepID=UPI001E1BA62F|nr:uncharacterized protein LOC116930531 [Daphnia magna]